MRFPSAYYVEFQYDSSVDNNYQRPYRHTTAKVYGPNDDLISIGHAMCVPTDNFSRRVGRKMALTRALEGFDRAVRRAVWRDYLASGARV